jgi:hypothetical protein
VKRQFQFHGPFPGKYAEIADDEKVIIWLMENLKAGHKITEGDM